MAGSIRLHGRHGLAPALLVCPLCGQETNGLALLGASADKVMRDCGQGGYQEYGHNRIPDSQPCGDCQNILNNNGVIIIADDIQQSLKLSDELVKVINEKLEGILNFDKYRGQVVRMKKAFWYTDEENVRFRDPKEWMDQ